MKRLFFAICLALALAYLAGCASVRTTAHHPPMVTDANHPLLQKARRSYLAGDKEQALGEFRAFRNGFGPSELEADCHLYEGLIQLEQQAYDGAEESFKACLQRPRTNDIAASAWVGLGDVSFWRGRYADARHQYHNAIDLHSATSREDYAFFRVGLCFMREGLWDESRSYFDMVVRRFPESPLVEAAREKLAFNEQAFFVELGSYDDEAAARETLRALLSSRIPGRLIAPRRGQGPYRVWVGGYESWDRALAAEQELEAQLGFDTRIVP